MTETEKEAERMRAMVLHLAEFLPKKVLAYGAAHLVQAEIWKALLKPYVVPSVPSDNPMAGRYALPPELVAVMPRLTRVIDRICRIVANPAADPHGENPWMDLAGDAIAGASLVRHLDDPGYVMADGLPMRVPAACGHKDPHSPRRCTLPAGHDGPHDDEKMHAIVRSGY